MNIPHFRTITSFGLLVLVGLWFGGCGINAIFRSAKSESAIQDSVTTRIVHEMQDILHHDQVHRTALGRPPGFSRAQKDSIIQEIHRSDLYNQQRLDSIISRHGYPGKSLVGDSLSIVGALVIHHSPLQFMNKHKALLMAEARKGEVDQYFVLGFLDRVHLLETGMFLFKNHPSVPKDTTINADSIRGLIYPQE